MKIRNGFVSNSSSSSFIMVAVKYPRDMLTDKLIEKVERSGFSIKYDGESGWSKKDSFLVGESLDIDECSSTEVYTVDWMERTWAKVSEIVDSDGENVVVTGIRDDII